MSPHYLARVHDAMLGLLRYIAPDVPEQAMSYYLSDDERAYGEEWLHTHHITEFDSFFTFHPGGRGRKQWGPEKFAALIDRISSETHVRIVVIGGMAEENLIGIIRDCSQTEFDILTDVTVGQMAAVIERSDMFISNDTGPLHVSCALGRPSVGIFISSDYRVYGPRGKNGRIVIGSPKLPSVDDVMIAVQDLLNSHTEMELDEQ